MPRKEQGWVTFQTSEEERKILEEFCQHSQRTKTEILRELVRGLDGPASSPSRIPTKSRENKPADALEVETTAPKRPLKVSSRNILKGVVKQVIRGEVNTQVTLMVVHEVELTSIITTNAADELEIIQGTEAYAVIKSNDISIAKD
ncbi:molybdopterin-binding protein [Nodularia harveyana UHCC-0300]|uniref:Molybdopterin-binding protein n=1 Tax=Nodularia harveyana UHCC-0300 TaxID=2974287 RepID=A0ABU5UD35_9CYAN|nr:molybdopterin-binding protein [Nodularia harveyana]MEA5581064.1 molybdopterin-binding protein [Nodularia harveyana UHCC-0300]